MNSICYSADGDYLLAGGNSKFVNIYEIKHRILLKKYVLSNNRSLDGILYKLNNKNIMDNVNLNEIDQYTDSEYEERFFYFIKF